MSVSSTVVGVLKKAWMVDDEQENNMTQLTVRPTVKEGVFHVEEDDVAEITLADVRNDALADLATILTEVHGPRCAIFDPTCSACSAWTIFDLMEKLTRSDELHQIVVHED